MSLEEFQSIFPNLNDESARKTSEQDINYNCFAHAANDNTKWWSPDGRYYWIPGIERTLTLDAFIKAFATLGYSPCELNSGFEEGFEKVAIYCNNYSEPTHMSRQLENKKWTSKLGSEIDIEHDTLEVLESDKYGTVKMILKRPTSSN